MVRRCARCRYARTTCRGVLLVGCRAPALRLCPLCCVSPARPATAPLCVRPRCAGGHSAPYRPAILNVARPLLCALAAPGASPRPIARCGKSLVHCYAPSLRLGLLCCVPPARHCCVRVRVRYAPSLRLWPLCAVLLPLRYVARPLLCALAAPGASPRRTAPLWCALALAVPGASPHVPPRCGARSPSLRLGPLRTYRPAILCRSSAAVRPRCAWGFSAPYRPLW
jgi:hypothetical protein